MRYPLTRRSFLGASLACAFVGCRQSLIGTRGTFAFSLRQAERLVRAGHRSAELMSLAGMNRALGLVHDSAASDIVLVGRRVADSTSLSLDDLAAAIQARVVHREWPLVSIDKVADTPTTGLQRIRWEGGIEANPLGAKLLAADEILKKAALGLDPSKGLPVRSYFDLCAERAANGELAVSGNRFWFHASDAALLTRENVFLLQDLSVGVKSVMVAGAAGQDELAIQYAAAFTTNYGAIAQRHAGLAALKPVFDAVAVARGIETLPPRLHEFWARQYQPARVGTPSEYPLLRRRERVKGKNEIALELNGGADTRIFVQRLQDSDPTAFQDAVLKTRPAADALWWPLPLSAWAGQAEAASTEDRLLSRASGSTIYTKIGPYAAPTVGNRGGIYADVPVGESDIQKK